VNWRWIAENLAALLVVSGVVLIGRSEGFWPLIIGVVLLTFGIRLAIDLGSEKERVSR
jgi:hypothetical protein